MRTVVVTAVLKSWLFIVKHCLSELSNETSLLWFVSVFGMKFMLWFCAKYGIAFSYDDVF